MNTIASLSDVNLVAFTIHAFFLVTIVIALMAILFMLGTKAKFIYGIREGFISIIVHGVENGAFYKLVGAMKGHRIDQETADIIEDEDARQDGFMGFKWIGLWPVYSAMVFNNEQIKIVNKEDGTISLKREEYKNTIYVPIQSTERLVSKSLELNELAMKIDLDVVITFKMTNAYVAKIKNRGSVKILKANVEEGLRELAANLNYSEALKIKSATGEAECLKKLVMQLNEKDCGFGTLSETTGYQLISVSIVAMELSGANAAAMMTAFASVELAEQAKLSKMKDADGEKYRLEQVGIGNAAASNLILEQTVRRITEQKGMSDAQAIALAIENGLEGTGAQVVNIGSGGSGASAMFNIDGKKNDGPKNKKGKGK